MIMIARLVFTAMLIKYVTSITWQTGLKKQLNTPWSYDYGLNGPETWGAISEDCGETGTGTGSKFKSPINFSLNKPAEQQTAAWNLKTHWTNTQQSKIWLQNTQHTIVVTSESTAGTSNPFTITTDTPTAEKPQIATKIGADKAASKYEFSHLTFHWGERRSGMGSEHQNTAKPGAVEAQFHFWLNDAALTVTSYETALEKAKGATDQTVAPLLIVSVIYEEEAGQAKTTNSKELEKILDFPLGRALIRNVKGTHVVGNERIRNPSVTSAKTIDFANLFPETNLNWYTYIGQQTSPPCRQAAWMVMEEYGKLNTFTIEKLRTAIINERVRYVSRNYKPMVAGVSADQKLTRYKQQ